MDYDEFAKISQGLGGGACGREMWPEVEHTYMSTHICKSTLAYVYWNKTGYYEQLAHAVKKYDEEKEKFVNDTSEIGYTQIVMLDSISDWVIKIRELVKTCNKLYTERPARFRRDA